MFIENHQKVSKGFDNRLIIYYILLIVMGWLTIFSSSFDPSDTIKTSFFSTSHGRQLIWIATSILIAITVLLIDGKLIQHYAYHIYFFFITLMVGVLIFGTEISGAKAWIKIGALSIQPTEFTKYATALALAKFFNEGKTSSEKRNIWILASIIIAIPIFIIMLQKDTGSALVFFSFIILFYREGLSGRFLVLGIWAVFLFVFTLFLNELYAIALLISLLIAAWIICRKDRKKVFKIITLFIASLAFIFVVNFAYNNVFQPHQKQRIDTLLGKTSDPQGADFNLNQSKIAIGSGGFFGKGYLKGTQTKLNFVPEQSTDFIFCGIGEEWGFMGSLFIISIFTLIIIRLIRLSEKQRNSFTKYYGYGIAGIIAFHFFINIGMTIGLVPIIGIPLPFISYGGSSLWAFTLMLFTFIKLNDN